MKLQNLTSEKTETLNLNSKKKFTVDTSNQMIVSILRDKLYSNKVAAVCREVASNSRDANREVGKGELPITINISSSNSLLDEECSISFKDSGLGISPSRIDNVFLKYGSSTKRDSNNQTGGFGIGAKTPFAYTNEFLISTISEENGVRLHNVYQSLISNEGGQEVSQLILVSSMETTEETGTEIIVPIKGEDRNEFLQECLKATSLWEVQPTIMYENEKSNLEIKEFFKEEDFRVIYGEYQSSLFDVQNDEMFLEVDGIPYSLSTTKMGRISKVSRKTLENSFIYSMITRFYKPIKRNVLLRFKTGDINLSASREEIEYTEENINLIMSKFTNLVNFIETNILEEFESKKIKLEKIMLYNSYGTEFSKNITSSDVNVELIIKDFYIRYSAKKVIRNKYPEVIHYSNLFNLSSNKLDFFQISKDGRFSFTKTNLINHKMPNEDLFRNNLIVFKSVFEKSNYNKNLTLQKEVEEKELSGFIFLSGEKGELIENDFVNLLKGINVNIINYEEVEKTKVQRTSNHDVIKKDKNLKTIFGRNFIVSHYSKKIEYATKLKMTFNIEEKQIVDFDFNVKEDTKIVLVPLSEYVDLKSLDKRSFNLDNLTTDSNLNTFKVSEDEEGNSFIINQDELCRMLQVNNYKFISVKEKDLELVKKDKNLFIGLKAAFEELLKNKEFLKLLVSQTQSEEIKEINIFTKGSYLYEKYFNSDLRKKYLLLNGLDLFSFKIPKSGKIEQVDNYSIFRGRAILELAMKYIQKTKIRDLSGYLKEEFIKKAEEELKVKYPLISFLYENIERSGDYAFSDYKTSEMSGKEFIKNELIKMIDLELSKIKK
tara:strand:- start:8 stop:2497 length:2490 start_codon:yes stop_codon:yes gene_type:complete